ncbi:MAG TPA: mannosyltransferase family protein [Vicinamibacterales bacterium]|nr:mannosyltransferase family protein [Vicinamibacterales bacterium]
MFPPPPPPASILSRVLDVITVVCLLIGITVWFTGGFREWTPFGLLSVRSVVRPLVIALVLIAIRHWLQPRPTIVSRYVDSARAFWRAPETRAVFPVWISTRAAVLLVGFLAIGLFGYRADVPVPWRVHQNEIANLPARWDTGWYMDVAINGYQWSRAHSTQQQNIAFFPVYPMLMRYGSLLFGRDTMWTGVAISWVAFFAALVYLFRLARQRLGDEAAITSVGLIACYPFAFFFSTAYTEALFLLTIVAACYHFERDELWRAMWWGLAAGLSRPNGCLLSIVLALIAIPPVWPDTKRLWQPALPPPVGWSRLARRMAVASAPGVGMLIYSTYIWQLTGHPLQWALQNAAWGRVYAGLDVFAARQAQLISENGLYTYAATRTVDSLQLAALLFVLVTVWPVYRRLGLAYAAMIVVNVLLPVMMGGLLSIGRVTSVLFPTFLWLGAVIPPSHRAAWLGVFAMLQAICAALFFTWRPLY